MRLEWHGDADLADGKLQSQYQKYKDRLKFVGAVCRNLLDAIQRQHTVHDLKQMKQDMMEDLAYVSSGMYSSLHLHVYLLTPIVIIHSRNDRAMYCNTSGECCCFFIAPQHSKLQTVTTLPN